MKKYNKRKNLTEKNFRIIFCSVMCALLALFVIGLFIFNCNYAKIYGSPQVVSGKADFEGVDIPSRDVACNLAGEWEFFYNRWIITDNDANVPDGIIKLPDLWTWKNYGTGSLSKTGFASYRLRVENVQPDINIIVYRHYSNYAYRVFINGELNYRSGTVSKNTEDTIVTGKTDEQYPYKTDGSPIEIVIELSATDSGGFNTAPWLAATTTGNSYGTGLRKFNYIALGITTAAVVISALTYVFFRYKRDITAPAFMLALYAHFLSSRDMLYVFGLQITAATVLQLISAITAFILLAVHLRRNGARPNTIFVIITSIVAALCIALTIFFYGTPLSPVFAFLLFTSGCAYLIPISLNNKFDTVQRIAYGVLFTFILSVYFFEMCDALGLLVFGTEFIFTFVLMIIIACFTVLWLWKMAKTARSAIRVSELECELSSVKNQALKAQIEPHFIYNSLTAIQSRYRDGMNEGDKAIEQFAKHLRLITDSNGKDIIPFEDEIRNVLNYFELENLRANGKLNLYLDLNYTDFSVPILSLQPLVENAVRHGEIQDKDDGYIQISSNITDNAIVISVTDNGKGFDINKVSVGVGLQNARKRLELMNAETIVESERNRGTKITIKIPLE